MAQPKPLENKLQNDRECASNVDSCGYSANHSASQHTASIDHEILACVGLAVPATTFSSDQSGKILHLFPQFSAPSNVPMHLWDIENLSLAELKKAYSKEHNSWRSRKSYAEEQGIAFHPPWQDFRNYLRELGPIPAEGYTLDKIAPAKGYVPGNVRWASKETQTHNRPNTILLTYKGERYPLGVWAKRTGQAESTLRSRRKKGWLDENVITGHPPEKSTIPPHGHPWPVGHAQKWEDDYMRDTGGHSDRFRYIAHITAKCIRELSAEVDSVSYSDDHEAKLEEKNALDDLTRKYVYWVNLWRQIQKERMKHHGLLFTGPDDYDIKSY